MRLISQTAASVDQERACPYHKPPVCTEGIARAMNPIVFAMRRPLTVMVGVVAIALGSGLALSRISIDVFPNLNLPVVYVAQPYGGMDPAQMEGLLTNYYEYHFLYIAGIHHVESIRDQNWRYRNAARGKRHAGQGAGH